MHHFAVQARYINFVPSKPTRPAICNFQSVCQLSAQTSQSKHRQTALGLAAAFGADDAPQHFPRTASQGRRPLRHKHRIRPCHQHLWHRGPHTARRRPAEQMDARHIRRSRGVATPPRTKRAHHRRTASQGLGASRHGDTGHGRGTQAEGDAPSVWLDREPQPHHRTMVRQAIPPAMVCHRP